MTVDIKNPSVIFFVCFVFFYKEYFDITQFVKNCYEICVLIVYIFKDFIDYEYSTCF